MPAWGACTAVSLLVVAACVTGQPTETIAKPLTESAQPSRPTQGETQEADTSSPSTGIALSEHWWFILDVRQQSLTEAGVPETIGGFRLRAGLFDGRGVMDIRREFPLDQARADFVAAAPFAVIAGDEALLYGFFDGQRSQVRLVSVPTGDDVLLYETEDIVHFAVFDHRASVLYYVPLDLATRRDKGVWRLPVDQPDSQPELVIGAGRGSPRQDGWYEQLWLADGGARLVARDCTGDGCRIQVLDTATGRMTGSRLIEDSGLEVYGVAGDRFFFDGNCERPCPVSAFSLTDGGVEGIGNICQTAAVAEGESGPTLLYERCPNNERRYEIIAHDLQLGIERVVYEGRSTNPGLVPQSYGSAGYVAPPGWFLVGRDNSFHDQAPLMVNATNGATVELPHLGE
ncbi:MAG: hypothetical protein H0X16_07875 [Chloroflexi bacterium]|nr:hypothetical protein [Chloroflexota bacterium]